MSDDLASEQLSGAQKGLRERYLGKGGCHLLTREGQ